MMENGICAVPGVYVGHAQDERALTGCTVCLFPAGAVAGVDVRGSAPGTRETDLLSPVNLVERVHAIVLAGGSAFGLDAAGGVMQYLAEQGIGFATGAAMVPIVPAAVLYDLAIGDGTVRPDAAMGYAAAVRASRDVAEGNVGAGTGATVGKVLGMDKAMKGGLGTAAAAIPWPEGPLIVGALVAVNALGDIRDPSTGRILAGPRINGRIADSVALLPQALAGGAAGFPGQNTTIGIVATNARLNKAQATKVAQMAQDGLARTIYPAHTMLDGDTVFAVSAGEVEAPVDLVGALAAQVTAEAIVRAVTKAESAGGLPAWRDIAAP